MRYAAFFRGINVGGQRVVKMADLRALFSKLGFQAVQSYIQSGNVLFASEREQADLSGLIAEGFQKRFGFASDVILRSADEIDGILRALPFTQAEIARAEAADPAVAHVYVFLSESKIDPPSVPSGGGEDGRLVAAEREVYLLCMHSIRKTKLAAPLLKPNAAYTSRNLKTMRAVQIMLRESAKA